MSGQLLEARCAAQPKGCSTRFVPDCVRFRSLFSCIYSYGCQIESLSCHIEPPRLKCQLSYYARPTKPKVATLMRTSGGNTARRARKHSPADAPLVNSSSITFPFIAHTS